MFKTKLCKNVLSADILNQLIADFAKNADEPLAGRNFNTDTQFAIELLTPILKTHLPGEWIVDGGNYFKTVLPYRMHCDSGKDTVKRLYYNVVIPLQVYAKDYNPDRNKLIVTNQTWSGDAAFFVKGNRNPTPEYNICVTDYSEVGNLSTGVNPQLADLCSHLSKANLEGLTINSAVDWTPGDIILFQRNLIHASSNWPTAGVTKKLGLSLFTSYLDQTDTGE